MWPQVFDCSLFHHVRTIHQIFDNTNTFPNNYLLCQILYSIMQINHRNGDVLCMIIEGAMKITKVICSKLSIFWDINTTRIAIQLIIHPTLEFVMSQPMGQYFGSAQNGCQADLLVDNVVLELLDDGHNVLPVVRCLAMG